MKKLFLTFFLIGLFLPAFSQDYRFYGGIQGGPKISFSNAILPGQHDLNYKTFRQTTHQEGIMAGYNFRNNRLSLEAGYSLQRHAVMLKFWDNPNFGKTPELTSGFSGDQLTILSKATLNNPESRVRFRTVLGGAFFMKWWKNQSNINFYNQGDGYGFIAFPYAENPDQKFAIRPGEEFEVDFAPNVWLIQAGVEVEARITKQVAVSLSAIYQSSFRPVDVWSVKYSYNYDKGVLYEAELPASAISKAEALNLNLGLLYYFSARN